MVSLGDADISLHIWICQGAGGGYSPKIQNSKYSKCHDLPIFELGGGVLPKSKLKILSAMICLNLNFWGGRGDGGRGDSPKVKTQSAKSWPNFHYRRGGGGVKWEPNLRIG